MPAELIRRLTVAIPLLASLACASGAPMTGSRPAGSRSLITREELAETPRLTAFEVIQRLRPTWLRYRGQSVLTGPEREGLRVYLDGAFYGDADALRQVTVDTVQEIRFLDSRQATLRYGTGHTVGAIVITTRQGG